MRRRTEEKKDERAKERLDAYYRRNYKVPVWGGAWAARAASCARRTGSSATSPPPSPAFRALVQDYFDFEAGNIRAGNKGGLSDKTQGQILKWLEDQDQAAAAR